MSTTRTFPDGRSWRKSSRSGDNAGTCLYATTTGNHVGVRDSKDGDRGPHLWLAKSEWTSLLNQLSIQSTD